MNEKTKKRNPIAVFLSGQMLTQESVIRHLPYLLFLAFLGLIYIANGYMAEASVRRMNALQQEIKELRSEQISMKSELNNTIIESELKKIIAQRQMGLEESVTPPKKLVVEPRKLKRIN
ncbi:MAG: hypothetical protein Kow0075_09910 [Salibacteraceae bacterium]